MAKDRHDDTKADRDLRRGDDHHEEHTRLADYQRQAAAATSTIEEAMSLKNRGTE